jgi:membrane-associated protease RseP (regulator of RpoE activity)
MNRLMLVPVIAAFAAPLAAQTPVVTRAQQKEVRAQTTQIRDFDALRALKLEIEDLRLLNLQKDSMWRAEVKSKGDPRRIQLLIDDMDRNIWPLLAKQSQLTLACADLRGPFEGWIGVVFDRDARWTKDPQTDRITVNFFGRPKIAEIETGSPAAQAGVQSGDEWLALNGRSINDSVEFNELDKPGAPVAIRTSRVGKLMDVVVVIGKRPFPDDVCSESPKPPLWFTPLVRPPLPARGRGVEEVQIVRVPGAMPSQLFMTTEQFNFGGAVLRRLDEDQRERLKLRGAGVLVSEVVQATPAAAAGIKSFDFLVVVNGAPVASLSDVARAIRLQPAIVTMTLQREGKEIVVRMPAK